MTAQQGAYLLSGAMLLLLIGRFTGTPLLRKLPSHRLLLIYAAACICLMVVVSLSINYLSVLALMVTFFFLSIMFPTIFALGIKHLGSRTKIGSSFMIMAIVGGAIMPNFMGRLADDHHTARAFILPAICFLAIAAYAAAYPRLAPKEAEAAGSEASPEAAEVA